MAGHLLCPPARVPMLDTGARLSNLHSQHCPVKFLQRLQSDLSLQRKANKSEIQRGAQFCAPQCGWEGSSLINLQVIKKNQLINVILVQRLVLLRKFGVQADGGQEGQPSGTCLSDPRGGTFCGHGQFLASQITQGQQHSICQRLKVQLVLKPASVFLPSFTTLKFLPNLIQFP